MDNIRERLLGYFFDEPEKEFYVRELAKLVKKSPTTISKHLVELKKEGLLISDKKLGHLFFRADVNDFFKDWKLLYNIRKIRNSGLIDYLEDIFNHPSAIVLFGSFRKAENTKESDVDVLVISPVKKKLVLEKFEKKIGNKIQVLVYSREGLSTMKNKGLLNNFINGHVLRGYIEV